MWGVSVQSNAKQTTSGRVDGKKIVKTRKYEGKNIGKSNQTTPPEQALIEAKRDWIRMVNKGKKPKQSDLKGIKMMKEVQLKTKLAGGRVATIKGGSSIKIKSPHVIVDLEIELVKPMKAQVWKVENPESPPLEKKPLNRIKKYFNLGDGVWVQPKLDGIRCVSFVYKNNKVVMSSNGKKQFPWFEHIRNEILDLSKRVDLGDGLDGELYIHHTDFSIIQSMSSVARSVPHPQETTLEYHVFDVLDRSGKMNQKERLDRLNEIFDSYDGTILFKVPTYKINDYLDVNKYHIEFVSDKYEGVIVRDLCCTYSEERSHYIQKYKDFDDSEFEIIGAERDKGVTDENFVWICKNEAGDKFKVKQTGKADFRINLYKNKDVYVGKMLTVRYQGFSLDGIPRFPIGLHLRDKWDM